MTKKFRTAIIAVFIAVSAFVVGAFGYTMRPVTDFPFRHNAYDLKVAWNVGTFDQHLVVEGLIKNVRFFRVKGIDLNLALVDNSNRVISKGGTLGFPGTLEQGEVSQFSVTLDTPRLSPGDRLRFQIIYHGSDGDRDATLMVSNFLVDGVTGVALDEQKGTADGW